MSFVVGLGRSLSLQHKLGRALSVSSLSSRPKRSLLRLPWIRRKKKEQLSGPGVVALQETGGLEAFEHETDQRLEKFIPVTRRTLVKKVMEEEGLLSWQERRLVESFAASLDAYFSQRFYRILEETKLLYDPVDPDKDTIRTQQMTKKEMLDNEYWLLQRVEKLLDKSNFFKIPNSQLCYVLQEHDVEGVRVRVDPDDYETLRIWTRGKYLEKSSNMKRFSSWVKGYVGVKPHTPKHYYTRVFVAVRSKSEKKLHLKTFKDVPCNKLEYLLPDGKVRMSKFDKGFLASSVFAGASVVALKYLPVLSDYKVEWMWMGLGLAGLIGARAAIGYKNKRNQYLVNLSTTLYYKTVSNNRGVLTLLADRAVDEEFKEAMLAYVFLLSPRNRRGVPGTEHTDLPPVYDTADSLRERVEEWLLKVFQLKDLRFDIEDALEKLENIGLLIHRADGTLSVYGIEDALEVLPQSTYQWVVYGALRDTQSSDEQQMSVESKDSVVEHGWR